MNFKKQHIETMIDRVMIGRVPTGTRYALYSRNQNLPDVKKGRISGQSESDIQYIPM